MWVAAEVVVRMRMRGRRMGWRMLGRIAGMDAASIEPSVSVPLAVFAIYITLKVTFPFAFY